MPGESGYVIRPADRTTVLGEIFAGQGPPDPGQLAELAGRYGLDLDLASVPRLAATHGLRVPGAPPGTP